MDADWKDPKTKIRTPEPEPTALRAFASSEGGGAGGRGGYLIHCKEVSWLSQTWQNLLKLFRARRV